MQNTSTLCQGVTKVQGYVIFLWTFVTRTVSKWENPRLTLPVVRLLQVGNDELLHAV